ncbi:MAG TPA: glycosyltransferase [Opitutaceae bacterium]|nr:glycosyltransferase [Opitutaceae bacterium]
MTPRVLVVIATFRRPERLGRALLSLHGQGPALGGAVVVNNSRDAETARVAAEAPIAVRLVTPERNLGTGGGVARGLQAALEDAAATHAWIMDDDADAMPGALEAMLAAVLPVGAAAVTPLITDESGAVRWFPGPLPQPAWDVIRSGVTPAEFRARCGGAPLRWSWSPWPSLLVTREAVAAAGVPRADFWFQSSDLEYTLRLSRFFTCVLAPAAVCRHLPPPEQPEQRRMKDLWTLQNNAFLGTRLRHGRRILRHLPGNHYRYWRNHGRSLAALGQSWAGFWRGAALGRLAGEEDYYVFLKSFSSQEPSAPQASSTETA